MLPKKVSLMENICTDRFKVHGYIDSGYNDILFVTIRSHGLPVTSLVN